MRAFVINLDDRHDKLLEFRFQNDFPFHVERFSGIIDNPRDNGCAKSHLEVIGSQTEFPFVVFEDDCVMLEDWDVVEKAISELPKDWDALWLGGTVTQNLDRVSDSLFRVKRTHCLHAVIYNSKRMVDYILSNFMVVEGQKSIIDLFYFEVQEKFNCYITYPICATQRSGYSDISEKDVNYYDYIINSYNKHTNGL